MKKVKIGSLKDGAKFKLGKRKSALTYKVVTKAKGFVVFTSLTTEYSGAKKVAQLVFVL